MIRRPPRSPLFPDTPLFRSLGERTLEPGLVGALGQPEAAVPAEAPAVRSEEHTSELQSHSFISYAVFCLNDPAPTEISSLSRHAALPISRRAHARARARRRTRAARSRRPSRSACG